MLFRSGGAAGTVVRNSECYGAVGGSRGSNYVTASISDNANGIFLVGGQGGDVTVSSGILQISRDSCGANGTVSYGNITNNAAVEFMLIDDGNNVDVLDGSTAGVDTCVFTGVISGTGTVTKSGSATLRLSGANTFTGDTTVSTGKLQLFGSGDRKSTRLNSSHVSESRMPSSA